MAMTPELEKKTNQPPPSSHDDDDDSGIADGTDIIGSPKSESESTCSMSTDKTTALTPETSFFPSLVPAPAPAPATKAMTTVTPANTQARTSSSDSSSSSSYGGILLEGGEDESPESSSFPPLQQPQQQQQQQQQQQPLTHPPPAAHPGVNHSYHLLRQIREDQASNDEDAEDEMILNNKNNNNNNNTNNGVVDMNGLIDNENENDDDDDDDDLLNDTFAFKAQQMKKQQQQPYFQPYYTSTKLVYWASTKLFVQEDFAVATWIGFFALLNVTCANYVLSPLRDAVALQVGVANIPKLTLASSVLAFFSSVPIGWLFEAPDPSRRKVWKTMGLTRGETQGTSLALFYRFFALSILSYAFGFTLVDYLYTRNNNNDDIDGDDGGGMMSRFLSKNKNDNNDSTTTLAWIPYIFNQLGFGMYVAFFLVVHLMKLHSISLVWGVTTEAMEYEDVARKGQAGKNTNMNASSTVPTKPTKTRLQRLAMVGFGGTLGGLWGSILASSMANILHLPGLLILSAFLLEISAELSIELGRIMQKHWEEQQIFRSCQDLTSLDTSMQRSTSMGSMKRIASGNSLYRVASGNSIAQSKSVGSLEALDKQQQTASAALHTTTTTQKLQQPSSLSSSSSSTSPPPPPPPAEDDNTFTQRLMRGITTILRSRLLMAIFTYNALFASTSVLLSFQRAELVANRKANSTSISDDTAFLANINMASSMAVFVMQASGIGAVVAQRFGSRGSLALMPGFRLCAVLGLAWWHRTSGGQPPNLILFLMLDECTRVVNLAIAKPVRESLWRGLSNEARYEAKPIVDTLANRWGAGSASFCVSVVNKILLWLGMAAATTAEPEIFGLPPVLFLCLIVAAWWAMVSLDLGHIRKRIDMELKKHQ